jgi:hypothetical protein
MSKSEMNERETFTHWQLWMQTHFLGRYRTIDFSKIWTILGPFQEVGTIFKCPIIQLGNFLKFI